MLMTVSPLAVSFRFWAGSYQEAVRRRSAGGSLPGLCHRGGRRGHYLPPHQLCTPHPHRRYGSADHQHEKQL